MIYHRLTSEQGGINDPHGCIVIYHATQQSARSRARGALSSSHLHHQDSWNTGRTLEGPLISRPDLFCKRQEYN